VLDDDDDDAVAAAAAAAESLIGLCLRSSAVKSAASLSPFESWYSMYSALSSTRSRRRIKRAADFSQLRSTLDGGSVLASGGSVGLAGTPSALTELHVCAAGGLDAPRSLALVGDKAWSPSAGASLATLLEFEVLVVSASVPVSVVVVSVLEAAAVSVLVVAVAGVDDEDEVVDAPEAAAEAEA